MPDLPGQWDNALGAATQTTIELTQEGANAGAQIVGGTLGWVGSGTASYLDDVGDAAGEAIADQAGEIGEATQDAGRWAGNSALGVTETAAEASEDAGNAVGNFWSGALNTQTLMLILIAVAAVYLLANSDAGEAAAGGATGL